MLKSTRVSRSLDTSRLGQAMARPGMDPRRWVSLAIVEAVHVDPVEGVFVDVTLLPQRQTETARLGTEYAGNGFGFYAPLQPEDEVLVEAPSGDPDEGLILSRRLWSPSDPPPAEAVSNKEDVALRVRPGQNIRILVNNGGRAIVGGDEDWAALATRVLEELNDIRTKFDTHTHIGVSTGTGTSGAPTDTMGEAGSVAASKVRIE